MAELDELQWELDGLLMGEGTPFVVKEVDGLESSAAHESSRGDRQGDGVIVNRLRMRDRLVELTVGLSAASLETADLETLEAQKDALREVVYRRSDGVTPRLLRWRHAGVTKRIEYRPADGDPLYFPGTDAAIVYGQPVAKVRLHVADPNIYSDAYTDTSFTVSGGGTDTKTVTNDGPLCADPRTGSSTLGVWSLSITAGGSGCHAPYIEHVDFPGEKWLLNETFPASGTGTVGWDRVTRRGGVIRLANVRGGGASVVPTWLWLRPGDNDLRMGCQSGGFAATFRHRDTY